MASVSNEQNLAGDAKSTHLPGFEIVADYNGTVTFEYEGAGYRNVLGMYEIGDKGEISNVTILFANSSAVGSGGDLVPGVSTANVDLTGGTQIGFFILPNGYNGTNAKYLVEGADAATYEFRDAEGNAVGTDYVGPTYMWHIDEAGKATKLSAISGGVSWHSIGSEEAGYGLNADGISHTRFTLANEEGIKYLRMGFEDLYNGGDKDYDDTMFSVDLGPANLAAVEKQLGDADLLISRIRIDDTSPDLGQDIFVKLDVENNGHKDATDTSSTFYWSPTEEFDEDTAVELTSDGHGTMKAFEVDYGETKRLRYESFSELGSGYIFAKIDPNDAVKEEDETNNLSDGVPITVANWTGLADLKIDKIFAGDTELSDGEDLFVQLHVSNMGFAEAENTRTTFYWSATDTFDAETAVKIDADNHGSLKIGETDTNEIERVRYEDIAANGDGFIFGVIDADNLTEEGNEENNVSDALAVTLETVAGPDLIVSDFSVKSASLSYGEDLVVTTDITNQGESDARSVATSFYWSATDTFDASTAVLLDNDHQGRVRAGATEGNETEEIKFEKLAELGDGFVFAVVDDADVVAEDDETNNVSEAIAISVADEAESDLQITRLRLSQSNLEDGDDTFVYLDVTNAGQKDVWSTQTKLYWSETDRFEEESAVLLDTDNHGLLRGGETEQDERTRVRYEDLEDLGNGFIFGVIGDDTQDTGYVSDGTEVFLM